MNRKSFLRSFVTATAGTVVMNKAFASAESTTAFRHVKMPPYLKAGDTVAITCPASAVDIEKLECACDALEKWGLKVSFGKTVGKHWQRFGGTDQERLEDFQEVLDDDNIQAILFGRGGYGTMRIIDDINWDKFRKNPKWLIGYSDITVVHMHAHANLNVCTLHADMTNGFSSDPYDYSASSLQQALFGTRMEYSIKGFDLNRTGSAIGRLVGGNLTMINASAGSKSEISTKGKILFLEDVNEYKYSIDRLMMTLKRAGKLDKLAALIVGEFSSTKMDNEDSFTLSVEEIVWEKVKEYNYPVCFHFPAGHIADNRALKMGCTFELNVSTDIVSLTELI